MPTPWSPSAQAPRRAELAAYIRATFRPLLDDQARSERLLWWDQSRIAMWATHAFFAGDATDVAFANTILRYVRDDIAEVPGPNPFLASGWASVLALHGAQVDADIRSFALDVLAQVCPFGLTHDYTFHGYNDNMPVMWTWALAYAGEVLDNPRFTEVAWANLRQERDMLRRRGAPSEYGQGYASHRLTDMAHLAVHGPSADFREVALKVEQRFWAELAGHWSPAVAQLSGPSMRGGGPYAHETSSIFYVVFGDEIQTPAAPWQRIYEEYPAAFAREFDLDPAQFLMCYPFAYGSQFSAAEYHVPDEVAPLFYRKPVGFTFRCTAETGYVNEGLFCKKRDLAGVAGMSKGLELTSEVVSIPHSPAHGAQPHGLTTYHGANFALGTATVNMFGTSHAFRCTYRRRVPAAAVADHGDVFVRYNINDKVPCGRTHNTYWKSPEYSDEKENYNTLYFDQGRHHTAQDGPTALVLDSPLWLEHWRVKSLRTDVFFWTGGGPVGEVWVGDQPITQLPYAGPDDLITINEGAVYLALRPLICRSAERQVPLRLTQTAQYLMVSLYNYEGPEISLTEHEMPKLGNGFAFEARDAADYASFSAFQEEMRSARVLDQLYGGTRSVHYARPDLRLSLVVCPYQDTVTQRSVNGVEQEFPQFSYSPGTPPLPFLDAPPAVGFEDWDWIETQAARPAETYNPVD